MNLPEKVPFEFLPNALIIIPNIKIGHQNKSFPIWDVEFLIWDQKSEN